MLMEPSSAGRRVAGAYAEHSKELKRATVRAACLQKCASTEGPGRWLDALDADRRGTPDGSDELNCTQGRRELGTSIGC